MQQQILISISPDELKAMIRSAVAEAISTKPELDNLSLDEACTFLGVKKQSIYRKTSRNEMPFSKKFGKLFFSKRELSDWINKS